MHAECEGVRRGLLRLRSRGAFGPEGGGEATDCLQKDSRRTSKDIMAEVATCGGDRDGTRRVTGDTVPAAASLPQRSSQQNCSPNRIKAQSNAVEHPMKSNNMETAVKSTRAA